MVQPLLWLFVLGTGLSRVVEPGTQGLDFRTFLFPGVLATSVMFTAVFSGVSVVWDREFGFLREMLVAPISRTSIMAGKCLGGGIVATAQALVLVALAGLAGVPYNPVMLLELIAILFLASLSITAFGLLLGAKVANIQSVMPVIQTVITPMMFLSGALYPTAGLPAWLAVATKLNPLTYAVQPMRHVVFAHLDLSPAAVRPSTPGSPGWAGRCRWRCNWWCWPPSARPCSWWPWPASAGPTDRTRRPALAGRNKSQPPEGRPCLDLGGAVGGRCQPPDCRSSSGRGRRSRPARHEPGEQDPAERLVGVDAVPVPGHRDQDQGQHHHRHLEGDPDGLPPAVEEDAGAGDAEEEDGGRAPGGERREAPTATRRWPARGPGRGTRPWPGRATPRIPMVVGGRVRQPGALGGAATRRLAKKTAKTRNGVVKYSPVHSQKATLPWMNLSQWMIVLRPMVEANTPTGTNPPLIVSQLLARAAWTKNQAPPMYTDASTIAVSGGLIVHAKRRVGVLRPEEEDGEADHQERDDEDRQRPGRGQDPVVGPSRRVRHQLPPLRVGPRSSR